MDPRPDRRIASVRVSSPVDFLQVRAVYRDLLRSKTVVTPPVRRFVAEQVLRQPLQVRVQADAEQRILLLPGAG